MSMENDEAARQTKEKRLILLGLSTALETFAERMHSQGNAAKKITFLAIQAEKMAQRSWDLNRTQNKYIQRDTDALVVEVKAFAKEASEAAKNAGREALLGREVANAITSHSQDITLLARDLNILPDGPAVRARLRPLAITLGSLPERMKANAATIKNVAHIAALAEGLAERADKLAAGGALGSSEAVALCRDLRRFTEEATSVSLEMSRGSALAVQAISDLSERTASLSRGQLPNEVPLTALDKLVARVVPPPLPKEVWVSSAPKRAKEQLPTAAVAWGSKP
jgi:hypothetical protein